MRAYWPTLLRHRRLEGAEGANEADMKWVRCEGYDEGHEIDSRVHYYDREVGFKRSDEDEASAQRNQRVADAFERRRQQVRAPPRARSPRTRASRPPARRHPLRRLPDGRHRPLRRLLQVTKRKAHADTVGKWSLFERFLLAEMPYEDFSAFLRACDDPAAVQACHDTDGRPCHLEFEPPPARERVNTGGKALDTGA